MNYIDTKTAAYFLGIPVRTLNHYVKTEGAPKEGYDRYDPARLMQWYAGYCRRLVEEARSGASEKEARRRITLAKAKIAEMEADEKAGLLVRVDVVREDWIRVTGIIKSRLLQMAGALAPVVIACSSETEAQMAIDKEVRDTLTELSSQDEPKRKAKARRIGSESK